MMEVIYRNVTNTYFDYRRQIKKKRNRFKLSAYEQLDDEDSGREENLLSPTEDIEMQAHSLLPPQWIEKIEECSEDIGNIKLKLMELEKMKKKKLVNVLHDDQMIVQEIAQMCTEITLLIKNCEGKIQGIAWDDADWRPGKDELTDQQDDNHNGSKQDQRQETHPDPNDIIGKLKINAKKSLISQLKSISQTFHNKQKAYINELKKISNECNDYAGDFPVGEMENIQREELTYEGNNNLSGVNIARRNTDLRKISNTVIDLHHIFKELSVMLVEQGSMLDRIDYNLDLSIDKCEKGLNKLKIFHKNEGDKLAARCVSFLTWLIFLLLILIILKHSY
ncbi:syntaxin 16 [Plasmodium inui San Antonio 1]|uniref:Syntaxin 16 n=1 Tax=Plasmodium inui San Antonio 1 TaxID=1237626 RepID=W6ZVU6_9APIC|nr:syntaxin 16 [Plasmodium inui San Antonio 1]EUD64907.1 syntaxin 16 [Plasmodium inui San Antonio 1]